MLHDLQTIFGHLKDSKLQYFSPDGFLKNFKLRGEPVNVREQQVSKESERGEGGGGGGGRERGRGGEKEGRREGKRIYVCFGLYSFVT